MSNNVALKERVKLNLGISHKSLDDEIIAKIKSGRAELKRLGILGDLANGNNALIQDALIAYVCKTLASSPDEREGWERSWQISSTALKDTSEFYEED